MTSFEKFKQAFQGKKVLVMGLCLLGGGVGVAKFFAEIGATVTVTDLKGKKELAPSLRKLANLPIRFVLGRHEEEDFKEHDLIIRNPGVSRHSPFLESAKRNQVPVTMDAALFAKFCSRPIVGVTGTRGKTTTATLIYELLRGAGEEAFLAGNIKGVATLPLLKKIRADSLVVLELSSWELQGFDEEKISPHLAVVTNIYPDHLNRYKNMAEYVKDKKIIFKYQTKDDFLVLNQKNLAAASFAKEAKAKIIWFSKDDFPSDWRLRLLGSHNRENAAAAYRVGEIFKLYPQWMRPVFETFKGVEGRLEKIATIKGVEFVNDTTSTTPEAAMAALKSFNQPIVLLTGGASKNLDLADLAKEIVRKVKGVVLLEGSGTDELEGLIRKNRGVKKILGRFSNFKEAVMKVCQVAKPGDVVLLSPGFASFGMFVNEYDRGEQFKRIVKSRC